MVEQNAEFFRIYPNLVITQGVRNLFKENSSFWIADLVYSYQIIPEVSNALFQLYELDVDLEKSTGIMTCSDGDNTIFKKQFIPYTDYPSAKEKFYFIDNILMLPEEY